MLCRNCGKKISDDSLFCQYCGARVPAAFPEVSLNENHEEDVPREEAELKLDSAFLLPPLIDSEPAHKKDVAKTEYTEPASSSSKMCKVLTAITLLLIMAAIAIITYSVLNRSVNTGPAGLSKEAEHNAAADSGAQNYDKTFKAYRKAAESGDPDAQFRLAEMYANAQSVDQDLAQAFYWYKLAADNGNIEAKYTVYLTGEMTSAVRVSNGMRQLPISLTPLIPAMPQHSMLLQWNCLALQS